MSRIENRWIVAVSATALFSVGSVLLAGTPGDANERNKVAVLLAVELMNAKDYGQLGQVIAQDYRRHSQATPEADVESLEEFVTLLQQWDSAFSDVENVVQELIAEDGLVAIYGTYSGIHTGQMGPFAATGKRMSSDYAGYHRMENGKIAETWVTWDNMAIFSQLGISPCPEEVKEGD